MALSSRLAAVAGVAALTASPLAGAVSPAVAATPTPNPSEAVKAAVQSSAISWKRCGAFQCGELDVPLDYSDPSKGTITLSISRRPADDQARKQGVVFVNPGGPGGSAVGSIALFSTTLGRQVRSKFDIVGVDPRGVGGSDLAFCQGKPGEKAPELDTLFPWKPQQVPAFLKADEFHRRICVESKLKIMPYMTTADVARDMDRVREVLGQKQLNFYGVSYGSYLGATYANMFPDRVRSMVVDGVLDPVAWATGRGDEASRLPSTTRLRSDIGAHESLMAAIGECEAAGSRHCAVSDDIRDDWAALSGRLRDASVQVLPGTGAPEMTYDRLMALALASLYDPEGIPPLLDLIHEFRVAADLPTSRQRKAPAAALGTAYKRVTQLDRKNRTSRIGYHPPALAADEEPGPTYQADFAGVLCSETKNPTDVNAWLKAGTMADRRAPGFGPLWTASSSICHNWPFPGKNAYQGPFTNKPAGGVMVMTTRYDPATPFTGARALHALSPDSRMVTVNGWGHATLDVSGCATKARTSYIMSGKLPATDKICRPDHQLFTSLD